jgi:hypothetical protein
MRCPSTLKRELRAGGALLVVLVLFVGTAHAQAIKGVITSVGIGGRDGIGGVYREGSWVPVQVSLRNLTPSPFVGHLAVQQIDLDGDKVMTVGPEFVLPPGVDERTLWTYFWPRPDYLSAQNEINGPSGGITSVLVLDKSQQVITSIKTPLQGDRPVAGARAIVPEEDSRSTRFVVVLGKDFAGWKSFERMYGGTEAVLPVFITSPNALPDRVLGLDGVDVIVWDADAVRVSDVAPEFQLEAMLQWVKAGGHLIISVGTQGQEFQKAGSKLLDALPLTITGTRDIKVGDLDVFVPWGTILSKDDKLLVQVVGELKPYARAVVGQQPAAEPELEKRPFADHPLVVTGQYGHGAISVVTLDVSNPELMATMSERDWISFWTAAAGWRPGTFFTAAQVKQSNEAEAQRPPGPGFNPQIAAIARSPAEIRLGKSISQDVDVKDVTIVRLLVAMAFLALYWLLAGPVGHLVLRQYKVVHWSWWIFGGVVVLATAIAGSVVLVLHVNAYDVRHRTYVLGTVNSNQATAVSFYGVYAPVSGPVEIQQPDTGGLNYVAPMCMPTVADVKAFADPQSYELSAEKPSVAQPVFRNTLKKMQGRWTGTVPGISGGADFGASLTRPLTGTLTNNSGCDLQGVQVIVRVPRAETSPDLGGHSYLYVVDQVWRKGETLDLEKALALDLLEYPVRPGSVETALQAIGWKKKETEYRGGIRGSRTSIPREDPRWRIMDRGWRDELLFLLADARDLDDLNDEERCELVRGVGRMTDCTKVLRAAGALIVAHADNVASPVPLSVNDKTVAGKGSVVFAWALPVGGPVPRDLPLSSQSLLPTTSQPLLEKP